VHSSQTAATLSQDKLKTCGHPAFVLYDGCRHLSLKMCSPKGVKLPRFCSTRVSDHLLLLNCMPHRGWLAWIALHIWSRRNFVLNCSTPFTSCVP